MYSIPCRCGQTKRNFKFDIGPSFFNDECCPGNGFNETDPVEEVEETPVNDPFGSPQDLEKEANKIEDPEKDDEKDKDPEVEKTIETKEGDLSIPAPTPPSKEDVEKDDEMDKSNEESANELEAFLNDSDDPSVGDAKTTNDNAVEVDNGKSSEKETPQIVDGVPSIPFAEWEYPDLQNALSEDEEKELENKKKTTYIAYLEAKYPQE